MDSGKIQIVWGKTKIFYNNYIKSQGRPAYFCYDWVLGLGFVQLRHRVFIDESDYERFGIEKTG